MRKIDKFKNLRKTNLLAEQRYFKSKGMIIESMGETGLLEDKFTVDQLVIMALEILDFGNLTVNNFRRANFSRSYSRINCFEFDAELPITVNFGENNFYKIKIKINSWCEEDPDGPSGGSSFSIELYDTSIDTELNDENLYDMVSREVSKKLDELINEILHNIRVNEN